MAFYRISLNDIMNQAPEVTAVLNSITEYLKGWSLKMVLVSLPFLGVLYGSVFFIWWKIIKSSDTD